MKKQIYLDNSATTKICREALDKYIEVSENEWGNPSSLHDLGSSAEKIIKASKQTILYTIGAKDCDLVFTASGSEANNLAILGRAMAKDRYRRGSKIITTMGEHASVNEPLKYLSSMGFKIAYIATREGEIDFEQLERELTTDVILLTSMMVNNETGAVYDIPRMAKMLKAKCQDAVMHVDATQGYMKIPFTKSAIGADLITLSSHKIEGPKGVGALVIGKNVIKEKGLRQIIFGGGQEGGLRSGTENVPGIAAFATAAKLNHENLVERISKLEELREHLRKRIASDVGLSEISPTLPTNHAPHILNLTLPDIKSETMLHFLSSKGIYVSSGSACSSNGNSVSSALTAYGRTEKEADTSIRVSFSHENTVDDVDMLCDALAEGLSRLSRIKGR